MKRNWYAAIILLALCVLLFRAGQYVDRTTAGMQRQLEAAYALAEQGDYPAARRAYSRAANRALRSTQVLGPLVRRISCCVDGSCDIYIISCVKISGCFFVIGAVICLSMLLTPP